MLIENVIFVRLDADIWTGKVAVMLDSELTNNKAFTKGGLRLISSAALKPFYMLKARARRLLELVGVQVIEGSYAVPMARHAEVARILGKIEKFFEEEKNNFLINFENNIRAWRSENAELKDKLERLSPQQAAVAEALKFEVLYYHIGSNNRLEERLKKALIKKTLEDANKNLISNNVSDSRFAERVRNQCALIFEVRQHHPILQYLFEVLDRDGWSRPLIEQQFNKQALNALLHEYQAEELFQFKVEVPNQTSTLPRGKLMF